MMAPGQKTTAAEEHSTEAEPYARCSVAEFELILLYSIASFCLNA